MEKELKWIYLGLLGISFISCWIFVMTGGYILFPEKYEEPGFYCGVTNDMMHHPAFKELPDSLMKTVENGKTLFENNCAACHAIHMVVVGPALKDIDKRQSRKWLRSFVKDPEKMIASGNKYAVKLAEKYKAIGIMSSFSSLTNKQIDDIIEYCKIESRRSPVVY